MIMRQLRELAAAGEVPEGQVRRLVSEYRALRSQYEARLDRDERHRHQREAAVAQVLAWLQLVRPGR